MMGVLTSAHVLMPALDITHVRTSVSNGIYLQPAI